MMLVNFFGYAVKCLRKWLRICLAWRSSNRQWL